MATSARDFITSALRLLTVYAPGENPTADDLNDGLTWLNRMVDRWATQRLTIHTVTRFVHTLQPNVQRYTIGPGGDFDQQRPVWLSRAGLILQNLSPPIEIPLEVLTVKDWALTGIKGLESTQPTRLYYDYGFPTSGASTGMGQIEFWPVPQIAYDVAIYTPVALQKFPDLSTSFEFPPGYEDAIEYNLARRLSAPFGQPVPIQVEAAAREYLGDIKRANARLTDLSVDPALRGRKSGVYNWRSDTIRGAR